MTQYGTVSVHEYTSGPKEGERFLKFGMGEASGSDIQLPTPNKDLMAGMERERVLVWSLPEPMTKQETREFLDEARPDAVWAELKVETGAEDD
jgi:hypothetical protein